MKTSIVLTFSGSDRPGIVEALSRVVTQFGGNWERGRMARLAGRFAGILEVKVEEGRANDLARELERISGFTVRLDQSQPTAETSDGFRRYLLELTGQDREGIVREIAAALVGRGVNIIELVTDSVSAPMSGEQLFQARAELRVPSAVDGQELRRALEALSSDLMVDIRLEEGRP